MHDKFNIADIVKNAKIVALSDAIEALSVEHKKAKQVNSEMAKGLNLAIMFLASQKKCIKGN